MTDSVTQAQERAAEIRRQQEEMERQRQAAEAQLQAQRDAADHISEVPDFIEADIDGDSIADRVYHDGSVDFGADGFADASEEMTSQEYFGMNVVGVDDNPETSISAANLEENNRAYGGSMAEDLNALGLTALPNADGESSFNPEGNYGYPTVNISEPSPELVGGEESSLWLTAQANPGGQWSVSDNGMGQLSFRYSYPTENGGQLFQESNFLGDYAAGTSAQATAVASSAQAHYAPAAGGVSGAGGVGSRGNVMPLGGGVGAVLNETAATAPSGAELAAAGISSVRLSLTAANFDVNDPASVAEWRAKFEDWKANGIEIVLNFPPEFAQLGDQLNWPTPQLSGDPDVWDQFLNGWMAQLEATVGAFGDLVGGYEIWNEPDQILLGNRPDYMPGIPEELFAEILQRAYPIVHNGDSDANVIVGGLDSGQPDYLARVIQLSGGQRFFDTIAIHPYGKDPNGDVSDPNSVAWLVDQYERAFGVPVIITEAGLNNPDLEAQTEYVSGVLNLNTPSFIFWQDPSDGPFGAQAALLALREREERDREQDVV